MPLSFSLEDLTRGTNFFFCLELRSYPSYRTEWRISASVRRVYGHLLTNTYKSGAKMHCHVIYTRYRENQNLDFSALLSHNAVIFLKIKYIALLIRIYSMCITWTPFISFLQDGVKGLAHRSESMATCWLTHTNLVPRCTSRYYIQGIVKIRNLDFSALLSHNAVIFLKDKVHSFTY